MTRLALALILFATQSDAEARDTARFLTAPKPPAPVIPANCNRTDIVERNLSQKYGERLTAGGLDNNGSLLQVWTSEAGAWTLVRRYLNGMTCFESEGEHWRRIRIKPNRATS